MDVVDTAERGRVVNPDLFPDTEDREYAPSGPLTVRVTYVRPLPEARIRLALTGANLAWLRDAEVEPEAVWRTWPAADYAEALATVRRWAATWPAIQSGRWRASIVTVGGDQ